MAEMGEADGCSKLQPARNEGVDLWRYGNRWGAATQTASAEHHKEGVLTGRL